MKINKKGILLGGLFCLSVMLLSACGKKESKEIALIETEKTKSTEAVYGELLRGIEVFAKTNRMDYQVIESKNNEKENCEDAIKQAIKDGAKVVVLYGEKISPAVYDMQLKHKRTEFLFFEGIPQNDKGKEKFRENTSSIYFKEQEAGFLAGYAAVAEGHRKLGFIESKSNKEAKEYGSGFVQGAELAAKVLNLGQGEVNIRYKRIENGNLSPVTSGLARTWFSEGSEIIMTGEESLLDNVFIGAGGQENKKVIVAGDYQGESTMIETWAKPDYAGAINYLLTAYKDKKLSGGEKMYLGILEDGVGLSMDSSTFQNFSRENYKGLIKAFKEKSYQVIADYVPGGDVSLETNLVTLSIEE